MNVAKLNDKSDKFNSEFSTIFPLNQWKYMYKSELGHKLQCAYFTDYTVGTDLGRKLQYASFTDYTVG